MAMTFEYIRLGICDESQDKFGRHLQETFSPFPEDERTDPKSDKPRTRISGYEQANRHMAFGTQHKYATLSDSYTGVIHLISLFHAFLRCAANEKENTAEFRAQQLKDAATAARKLKALAVAAEDLVATAETSGILQKLEEDAWELRHKRLEHERVVIKRLFDAFHAG